MWHKNRTPHKPPLRTRPETQICHSLGPELCPHPVIRQHVLPVPLEARQRVEVARGPHDAARYDAGVVPRPHAVARARRLVLGEDREALDVSRHVRAALEHAERALALLRPAQLDVGVERGDDLGIDGRRLFTDKASHQKVGSEVRAWTGWYYGWERTTWLSWRTSEREER